MSPEGSPGTWFAGGVLKGESLKQAVKESELQSYLQRKDGVSWLYLFVESKNIALRRLKQNEKYKNS